jgi:hypothetical protein
MPQAGSPLAKGGLSNAGTGTVPCCKACYSKGRDRASGSLLVLPRVAADTHRKHSALHCIRAGRRCSASAQERRREGGTEERGKGLTTGLARAVGGEATGDRMVS